MRQYWSKRPTNRISHTCSNTVNVTNVTDLTNVTNTRPITPIQLLIDLLCYLLSSLWFHRQLMYLSIYLYLFIFVWTWTSFSWEPANEINPVANRRIFSFWNATDGSIRSQQRRLRLRRAISALHHGTCRIRLRFDWGLIAVWLRFDCGSISCYDKEPISARCIECSTHCAEYSPSPLPLMYTSFTTGCCSSHWPLAHPSILLSLIHSHLIHKYAQMDVDRCVYILGYINRVGRQWSLSISISMPWCIHPPGKERGAGDGAPSCDFNWLFGCWTNQWSAH